MHTCACCLATYTPTHPQPEVQHTTIMALQVLTRQLLHTCACSPLLLCTKPHVQYDMSCLGHMTIVCLDGQHHTCANGPVTRHVAVKQARVARQACT